MIACSGELLAVCERRDLPSDRESLPYAVESYHFKDLREAQAFAAALRSSVVDRRAIGQAVKP